MKHFNAIFYNFSKLINIDKTTYLERVKKQKEIETIYCDGFGSKKELKNMNLEVQVDFSTSSSIY